MIKLQHIAISVKDPEASAKFFVDVMEMKLTRRNNGPLAESCFVSDGHIEIALIRFKSHAMLGKEFPEDYEGLHHIGFNVDDLEEVDKRMAATPFQPRKDIHEARDALFQAAGGKPESKLGVEYKYSGPGGIIFDISHKGWMKKTET
ncbi:MAG: hypothetical protein JW395_1876 [Nitrospira sp.]|nr:hypothetical protein [Nitrospira sp.]